MPAVNSPRLLLKKALRALIGILVALFLAPQIAAAADDDCEAARNSLTARKQQISEYVAALKKASDENDLQIMELLNFKVNELIEQTRVLEKKVSECGARMPVANSRGVSATKSDEGKYATKSCDELKRALLPLTRRLNVLEKKQRSLFSELTSAERADLDSFTEEIKTIENILKTRCSPNKKAGPSKRRPRPQY